RRASLPPFPYTTLFRSDSGAFYRALTLAALEAGISPERWPSLDGDDLRSLGVEWKVTDDGIRLRVRGRDVTSDLRSPEVNAHVSDRKSTRLNSSHVKIS